MRKIVYITLLAITLGSMLTSCANRLCPAYASYPPSSRR